MCKEINASLERHSRRLSLAAAHAQETHGAVDVEVYGPDHDDHESAVESVDGGYWVRARVWVDADSVEDALEAEEARRRRSDADALDTLNLLLSAPEWPGASGMEDVCEIVRSTGRTEIPGAPAWERH